MDKNTRPYSCVPRICLRHRELSTPESLEGSISLGSFGLFVRTNRAQTAESDG
ncbi:hypothetical protein PISMIDRAFT_670717, partial [Pisolithus microcarpus 441]